MGSVSRLGLESGSELVIGSQSAAVLESGGKQKSNILSPSILTHSSPQLPPATSPLWVNLGAKLSTTHRHTQHQASSPTLGEGTTGTRPWSGLEVAGQGEEEVALQQPSAPPLPFRRLEPLHAPRPAMTCGPQSLALHGSPATLPAQPEVHCVYTASPCCQTEQTTERLGTRVLV